MTYQGLSLRAQIVGAPASPSGTTLSFRVFRPEVQTAPRTFEFLRRGSGNSDDEHRKLVAEVVETGQNGTVDALLKLLVAHRLNVIVSGGTSTGKTELGRRLLDLVHDDERIVTIEDSLELRPRQRNSVCLLASREEGTERSANHLLQATLRLRPDRIILGELRGLEAATFLDAINTGHAGSFTTIHAQSARKALDRLALLVMAFRYEARLRRGHPLSRGLDRRHCADGQGRGKARGRGGLGAGWGPAGERFDTRPPGRSPEILVTSDADSPDEPKQGAKSREVFSVYSSVSGKVETFEDPRVAGREFFLADPAEGPSVTHMVGNSARTMARTEVHGPITAVSPSTLKACRRRMRRTLRSGKGSWRRWRIHCGRG